MPKGKGGNTKKGGGPSASGSNKGDTANETPKASSKGGTSVKASLLCFHALSYPFTLKRCR